MYLSLSLSLTLKAARKVDTKVAKPLPEVAQKVTALKNQLNTSFQQVFRNDTFILDIRAGSKAVLTWF